MADGSVPVFVERPSDCYCTPDETLDVVRGPSGLWRSVGLDPFGDPESRVGAAESWDIRVGQDAYALDWIKDVPMNVSRPICIFANGPYSRGNPAATAKKCADAYLLGAHVQNLCPAAIGSSYWRKYVWPLRPAIAWLGRLSFRAGRDMHDAKGTVTAKRGELCHGNRHEIALVYLGPDRARFRCLWERQGKAVTLA